MSRNLPLVLGLLFAATMLIASGCGKENSAPTTEARSTSHADTASNSPAPEIRSGADSSEPPAGQKTAPPAIDAPSTPTASDSSADADIGSDYERKFAIIVGIHHYEHLTPLTAAENDAHAVKRMLSDEFAYEKPIIDDEAESNILMLVNEQASLDALRRAFTDWLATKRPGPRDSVLVYFSGHGFVDPADQTGYLATVGADVDPAARRFSNCLSVPWIVEQLSRYSTSHRALILDCCYSGALFMAPSPSDSAPSRNGRQPAISHNALAQNARRAPAFLGLCAARANDRAFQDGKATNRLSRLTSALLDVMRDRAGSPFREERLFTFSELAERVIPIVAESSAGQQLPTWGYVQTSGSADSSHNGNFLFVPVTPRPPSQDAYEYARQIKSADVAIAANDRRTALRHLLQSPVHSRGPEWQHLMSQCEPGDVMFKLGGVSYRMHRFDVAADARRIACFAVESPNPSRLYVIDAENQQTLVDYAVGKVVDGDVALSRDGQVAAVVDGGAHVDIISVASGERIIRLESKTLKREQAFPDGYNRPGFNRVYLNSDATKCAATLPPNPTRRNATAAFLVVWDVTTGERITEVEPLESFSKFTDLAFSPDGNTLAIGETQSSLTLRLMDLADRRSPSLGRFQITHDRDELFTVWSVAFSPDGKLLTCATDRQVITWDVAGGKELHRFSLPAARSLAYSSDSQFFTAISARATIRIYESRSGKYVNAFASTASTGAGLAFSQATDATIAAVGNSLKIFRPKLPNRQIRIPERDGGFKIPQDLAFVSPGNKLVIAMQSREFRTTNLTVWDASSASLIGDFPKPNLSYDVRLHVFNRYDSPQSDAAEDVHVFWGNDYHGLFRTRIATGYGKKCLSPPGKLAGFACSSQGDIFVTACSKATPNNVHFWDLFDSSGTTRRGLPNAKILRELSAHPATVDSVAVSENGQFLVTAGPQATLSVKPTHRTPRELKIWDLSDKLPALRRAIPLGPGRVRHLVLSPDNQWLSITLFPTQLAEVVTFHRETGAEMSRIPSTNWLLDSSGKKVTCGPPVFIDRNHPRVIVPGLLRIWDVQTGDELLRLDHEERNYHHLAVSPDQTRIAAATTDGVIVWRLMSKSPSLASK